MNTTPSPLMLANKTIAVPDVQPTDLTTLDPAKIVKAKHLRQHQQVQALIQGQPRGRVNTVEGTTRIKEGAEIEIVWKDGEPGITRKAAFRYYIIKDAPKAHRRSQSKAGAQRRARNHDEHLSSAVEGLLDAATVAKLAEVK